MSRKKRPNKSAQKTPPVLPEQKPPVRLGDVFATFMHEAKSIADEVVARRQMNNDVAEFLASKNLTLEFETWRAQKYQAKQA